MRSTSLRGPVRRSRFGALVAAGAVLLLWPPSALAHGLAGQADLPIPVWLFGWGAAVVLIVSFAFLALLWSRPELERDRFRPLPRTVGLALTRRAVEVACGATGVGLLALVVWAGLAGTKVVSDNLMALWLLSEASKG